MTDYNAIAAALLASKDWRSNMDAPGGIPTGGPRPMPTLSQGPAPTGYDKVFDAAYGVLGGTPDKRRLAETLTQGFDLGTLGMATGAYDGGRYWASTGDPSLLAASALPGGKAAALPAAKMLGIFAGIGAKTADHSALELAQKMASSGTPRESIWKETGWFRGVDDKWRHEIDDSRMPPPLPEWTKQGWGQSPADSVGRGVSGADAVVQHPALAGAYPDLDSLRVGVNAAPAQSGAYQPGRIGVGAPTPGAARSSLLHELQHAVQAQEGFAFGGNPVAGRNAFAASPSDQKLLDTANAVLADPARSSEHAFAQSLKDDVEKRLGLSRDIAGSNYYKSLAGEVEARAVEARRDLTPAQRAARPPWLDYDVPESEQIVRFTR